MAESTVTIKSAFDNLTGKVSSAGADLQEEIKEALKSTTDTDSNGETTTTTDLDPMKMLDLQFEMGKYNAMVEAASSVTKGLTDTAKTLAQRAGG